MTDETITVAQLHAELDRRFGKADEARRWTVRNILTPQNVGSVLVSVSLMLVSGTAMWLNLRHDVDTNTATIERHQIAQVEATARLDKRVDDEKDERQEADRRLEARSSKALDDINDALDELNRNIKTILQALPRQYRHD